MIFFSSDHHFGHFNVIKYCGRPHVSVEAMNEDLIKKWNATVGPEDTVYYLGDFSLGKNWVREILPKLNGKKALICGNHDWCHPIHYKFKPEKKLKHEKLYLEHGFLTVETEMTLDIAGQKVLLCHLPYKNSGDHGEQERYTELRPDNNGGWLIHGHVHEKWLQKGRQINVGVDVWDFKPVPITEIERIINETK